jgi:Trm5-related predicted tRNA methylase
MNSLNFIQDLLNQLCVQIPPKAGCRHNITMSPDGTTIELMIMGDVQRAILLNPTIDSKLSSEDIVDKVIGIFKRLNQD